MESSETKVLMIGPDCHAQGGIATVVNSYFENHLDERACMEYLVTMEEGSRWHKAVTALKSYFKFRKKIKACHILHVHMAAHASLTRKSFFIRKAFQEEAYIILHIHAPDFDTWLEQCSPRKQEKVRRLFFMANKVLVLSPGWKQFFASQVCEEDQIEVLPNGVRIPDCPKKQYDNHAILFLGRLGERKGIYDLLKVLPEIAKIVPDVCLYVGGDGEEEKCRSIIRKQGLEKQVKLLGWLKDSEKEQYFQTCSIFVLPSYQEGMPMALLEAMSYGLACVATNVGGIPQVIHNRKDGFRIQPGDLKNLKESLVWLLMHKSEKEKLGLAARQQIREHFNLEKHINRLVEIYEGEGRCL